MGGGRGLLLVLVATFETSKTASLVCRLRLRLSHISVNEYMLTDVIVSGVSKSFRSSKNFSSFAGVRHAYFE